MIVPLPPVFLTAPIAHRGFHDKSHGCPENSRAAMRAAIASGYAIECDLQLTADGQAVVFHDYNLERLTAAKGSVRQHSAAELALLPLSQGDGETVPTLAEILELVAGRAPLLIELKDQDGNMGPHVGALEAATARALAGYAGPVALMSFNPHSMAEMARIAPKLPRGLTTSDFAAEDWRLSDEVRAHLAKIADFDRVGASFISHQSDDLDSARVCQLRAGGVPVLCWTITSAEEEARARRLADNITFEGYAAALPA